MSVEGGQRGGKEKKGRGEVRKEEENHKAPNQAEECSKGGE